MLAKIIDGTIDVEGRRVAEPRARHGFSPTFPMGSYLTQPLTVRCGSLEEVRRFLVTCRYVSDDKLHGRDYWTPPEEFEKTRRGDCDCAAVWAWRQMVDLGIPARFVIGWAGEFGGRHAWLHVEIDGEWHVLEPFAAILGMELPRLWALRYRPHLSVRWGGSRLQYFEHAETECRLSGRELAGLFVEDAAFRLRLGSKLASYAARAVWMRAAGGRGKGGPNRTTPG